jgi:membrane protein
MHEPEITGHKLQAKVSDTVHFLKGDVWRLQLQTMPVFKRIGVGTLRIALLVGRSFKDDQILLRASALTYYTMLSIVPVAALAFGIAKGFGFQKMLEAQLYENFPGQQAVVERVMGFALTLLDSTRGGVIAGIGLALLFWAVIKVMNHIEASFNHIWQVHRSRSLIRKFTDYIAIMLLSPLLVLMQSSATVFITTQLTDIASRIRLIGYFSPLIFFSLKLIPYFLVWILFTLIYMVMPNTRVRLGAGLLAGVVAGTGYQLLQWVYITFQVGAARYNAIYGSFAALPLFLVWLQVSWIIVLFGAEIAFAVQHVQQYEFAPDTRRSSFRYRQRVALGIMQLIVQRFDAGGPPLTALQIAAELGLPRVLAGRVLDELVASRLLTPISCDDEDDPGFLPARDVDHFTITYILEALEARGVEDLPLHQTPSQERLSAAVEALRQVARQSAANIRLKDI